ncbi:SsrA-binding protein [Desulfonema limicola]|uniref:SsrA-binding protein n=1 Tax=Desulfonema limicola TaxID=45656 RepID=A0A975BE05_9BACT|nr:SsrA-binding protein SmpB [Desulfonema limicola]QTA83439.1 SsrA-binding protein [Desulfonema limicola]
MEKTKIITDNRKARFNYHILDKFEAGIVLQGTEVKSLRTGRSHLKDAYAKIVNGEVFVYQMHIGQYPFAYFDNHDPLRTRKLLLHKYEIRKLYSKVNEKGHSLIPLNLYFKDGRVKMTIALAKGKQTHDKRESIKKRDEQRERDRTRKEY